MPRSPCLNLVLSNASYLGSARLSLEIYRKDHLFKFRFIIDSKSMIFVFLRKLSSKRQLNAEDVKAMVSALNIFNIVRMA